MCDTYTRSVRPASFRLTKCYLAEWAHVLYALRKIKNVPIHAAQFKENSASLNSLSIVTLLSVALLAVFYLY